MADKQISDLVAATSVQPSDLFVLEQSATAKKLTGQILINWLTNYADGHGGIQSISISSSGTVGDGASHTITITMADTTTATFTLNDGLKGDQGDTWYFWIKYASDLPTSDADMSDVPDNYIGVYIGTASTAPTAYTAYDWYQWKGDKGDTGEPCEIDTQSVTYLTSSSGVVVPEGAWTTTIPSVAPGYYLWTRTQLTFTDGTVVTSYAVSRNGIDGSGAVSSVNSISPDPNGDIALTASDIPTSDSTSVQQHITSIESDIDDLDTYKFIHISGQITSLPYTYSASAITASHRVINLQLGTPSAITSDLTWTTANGSLTLSGTMASSASTTVEIDIVKM